MGVITFNGVTSTSLGIEVATPPSYEVAERNYEVIPIPGRNGALLMDTLAYNNTTRNYTISIFAEGAGFASLAPKIPNWLYPKGGYLRLEDSYLPLYYMKARYTGDMNIMNVLQQAGTCELSFDRKPERFLKTGANPISIANGTITNPTSNIARPQVKIFGSGAGVVNIGSHVLTISSIPSDLVVDSEIRDVYAGSTNANALVKITNNFPLLHPGNTNISVSGGVSRVEITPNWWVL